MAVLHHRGPVHEDVRAFIEVRSVECGVKPDVMVRLFGELEWHRLKRTFWASRLGYGTSAEKRTARDKHGYHKMKVRMILARLSKG